MEGWGKHKKKKLKNPRLTEKLISLWATYENIAWNIKKKKQTLSII